MKHDFEAASIALSYDENLAPDTDLAGVNTFSTASFLRNYAQHQDTVQAALRLATDVQAGEVKVLPVEATDQMHRKGGEAFYVSKSDSLLGRIPDVYKAMIAAAPDYDWDNKGKKP